MPVNGFVGSSNVAKPDGRPVTTDECIALSDDELVDATYSVIDVLAETEDERIARAGGKLIFSLGELLERFAPGVAQAELVRGMTPSGSGPMEAEDGSELLDALDGVRRRQAARLLRDTFQPRERPGAGGNGAWPEAR